MRALAVSLLVALCATRPLRRPEENLCQTVDRIANTLYNEGYYVSRGHMSYDEHTAIRADVTREFGKRIPETNRYYNFESASPVALSVLRDPFLMSLAKSFGFVVGDLQAEHLLYQKGEGLVEHGIGGGWHRDFYGETLKMICYLNNVDERAGAFAIIPPSNMIQWAPKLLADEGLRYTPRYRQYLRHHALRFSHILTGGPGDCVIALTSHWHVGLPLHHRMRDTMTFVFFRTHQLHNAYMGKYARRNKNVLLPLIMTNTSEAQSCQEHHIDARPRHRPTQTPAFVNKTIPKIYPEIFEMKETEFKRLANGKVIPYVGLDIGEGVASQTWNILSMWFAFGGRLFEVFAGGQDTARVGSAIAVSGMNREEMFAILSFAPGHFATVSSAMQTSLKDLQLDAVDVALLRANAGASPASACGGTWELCLKFAWKALVDAKQAGLAWNVGVSNPSLAVLQLLSPVPDVVQVTMRPGNVPTDVLEYCNDKHIHVIASATMAENLSRPEISGVATKAGRNVHQAVLRWLVQKGYTVVVKTHSQVHMMQNLDTTQWRMSASHSDMLDSLPTRKYTPKIPQIVL